MDSKKLCPLCGSSNQRSIFSVNNTPQNCVTLFKNRISALNAMRGNIDLCYCEECSYIHNVEFIYSAELYEEEYESTQIHSGVFSAFSSELANYIIEKYKIRNKVVLEVGCGKGEFLRTICDMGNNIGIGIDPVLQPGKIPEDNIEYFSSNFNESHITLSVDIIIHKMTLEHIENVKDHFLLINKTLINNPNAILFLMIPNAITLFSKKRFWDIYYEHKSYFTEKSLVRLMNLFGINVLESNEKYDDQYLVLVGAKEVTELGMNNDTLEFEEIISDFEKSCDFIIEQWKNKIEDWNAEEKTIVLWGGGSKAVSFLNTLGIRNAIDFVVDINPLKKNTFVPGSAQKVISPEGLKEINPDIVLLMNDIYEEEVSKILEGLEINVTPLSVDKIQKSF